MDQAQIILVDFPLNAAINLFVQDSRRSVFRISKSVGQKRFVPHDLPNFVVRNLVVMDILSK